MEEKMKLQYELLTQEKLKKYEEYIYPQLLEELEESEEKDGQYEAVDGTVLGIGTLLDGRAVAALVGKLEDISDVSILSLFVDKEHRRKKIGTGLVHKFLQIAAQSYLPDEAEEYGAETEADAEEKNLVMLKAAYILPEANREIFERFLEAVGFTEYVVESMLFQIGSDKLGELAVPEDVLEPDFIDTLEHMTEEQRRQISDGAELPEHIRADWSVFCEQNGRVAGFLLFQQGYGDTVVLISAGVAEEAEEEILIFMLAWALKRIKITESYFKLLISDIREQGVELVSYLEQYGGMLYFRCYAWADMIMGKVER